MTWNILMLLLRLGPVVRRHRRVPEVWHGCWRNSGGSSATRASQPSKYVPRSPLRPAARLLRRAMAQLLTSNLWWQSGIAIRG
jgi:hypothetical protein